MGFWKQTTCSPGINESHYDGKKIVAGCSSVILPNEMPWSVPGQRRGTSHTLSLSTGLRQALTTGTPHVDSCIGAEKTTLVAFCYIFLLYVPKAIFCLSELSDFPRGNRQTRRHDSMYKIHSAGLSLRGLERPLCMIKAK